ncbi:L type [Durusdinium trenchii]
MSRKASSLPSEVAAPWNESGGLALKSPREGEREAGDPYHTPSIESVNSGEVHGDVNALLRSGLADMSEAETAKVKRRLRLRLGALSTSKLVSGKGLHEAVTVLGLTRYSVEDMNSFVNLLADFIHLEFDDEVSEQDNDFYQSGEMPDPRRQETVEDVEVEVDEFEQFGHPVWEWPDPNKGSDATPKTFHSSKTVRNFTIVEPLASRHYNVVPAKALIDVLLAKEILLASDTNRLVAELTFVRINDLAAPVEKMSFLMYLEPFVAILIVANGIMIGFQTDPEYADWPGFIYFEAVFGVFLVLEILLRMRILRCRKYWCGPDRYWNWFDLVLGATGVADLAIQLLTQGGGVEGTSLLRFCRLIRLVRIVKVFRIKAMKDLRLMVKGLVAGIRTLALAFMLLFGVLYVISGFATIAIGENDMAKREDLAKYFENIPISMFTAFRCFTGECVNNEGKPIHSILFDYLGWPFIFSYIASYMLVTMGIFNVILAVYVDITMKAAKENDAQTAEQHSRESVRVARCTRELLKKFAGAYHTYHEEDKKKGKRSSQSKKIKISTAGGLYTDVGDHESIAITKDLFLLVIQDRSVQKLMDDLDLPHDRANLFEIIDADGSGTLQITELLHGLLKIRGDISKSDTIASYLATKAVQNMMIEHKEAAAKEFAQFQQQFFQTLQIMDMKINALSADQNAPNGRSGDQSGELDMEALLEKFTTFESDQRSMLASVDYELCHGLKLPVKPSVLEDEEREPPPPWTGNALSRSADSDGEQQSEYHPLESPVNAAS